MFCALAHGSLFAGLWVSHGIAWDELVQWNYRNGSNNLAGVIAWLVLAIMVVTLQPYVRKVAYAVRFRLQPCAPAFCVEPLRCAQRRFG
jgi:Ferric reductase like transmembrane component